MTVFDGVFHDLFDILSGVLSDEFISPWMIF